jgi:hypothetical protein
MRGTVAGAAALVLIGVAGVGSAASFDSARWRAGQVAVDAGIPAEDVDAGFEWVGFHYGGVANEPVARRSAPTPPGYMDSFPAAGNCGLVAASPQADPDFQLIKTISYSHWIGARIHHLWVYRYVKGCDAADASQAWKVTPFASATRIEAFSLLGGVPASVHHPVRMSKVRSPEAA